MAQLFFTQQV